MCGLCTLDLSGTLIKELPNSLSELESLKALLLRGCEKLKYVPYLGKLKALKELDLSGTTIEKFPEGMEKLVNLKYLLMNGAYCLQMLPTGLLLNLPCLELLHLPYEMQVQLEGIERLKQLERFEGRVQDMSDFNRFIESRPGKQLIFSYGILVGEIGNEVSVDELDFPTSERINEVMVCQYDFKNRKEKGVIMLAEDIKLLKLIWCEGLSNCLLDGLSNPRSLVKLEIEDCKGIECILRYEQLIMALQEIKLIWLPDFMGVIQKREIGAAVVASPAPPPPQVVFSSLRSLSIGWCHKMKKLGLPISAFQKLESIDIGMCEEIEEIIEVADDEDIIRSGEGEEAALAISLPKLKELVLGYLPRLTSISKATVICDSLQTIQLKECQALKKVPLYFASSTTVPPALQQILLSKREKEWWDSLEWEHPSQPHLLQPFLRFYP